MSWIPVKDKMPHVVVPADGGDPDFQYTMTNDVIALLRDGNVVRTYHDGDAWCYYDLSGCPQYDVVAWMPLPDNTDEVRK